MGVTKLVAAMLVGVGVVICSSNFNHTSLPKMNLINDPIFDFPTGTTSSCPSREHNI